VHPDLPRAGVIPYVHPAKCWNIRVSGSTRSCRTPSLRWGDVNSDNLTSAGNQQERPGIEQWVVGFVDREGCFSISVVRNAGCRLGWQVQHEFAVTQAACSRGALELLREVFGCGALIEQQREDGRHHPLMRFSVKRRVDLASVVVPFFEKNPTENGQAARLPSGSVPSCS